MTEGVTHYYYTQDAKHKNGTRFFMTTYTPEALERLGLLEETPLFKENMKTLEDESRELAMESGCEDRAMEETFEGLGMDMTFNQWKRHQYITGMCRENILKSYHDRDIDTFAYYFTEYQNDGHPLGRERAIKERDEIIQKKKALEKEVEEVENSQTSIDIMKKENKKLKEDNEKLREFKELIEAVWLELYEKDKYGCETSFKDMAELTNYETNLKTIKELYESINPS